ncbi:unnamed protein product [Closterium sp. Naga37s-1]|nr:unnamed protein product [Closterium sp. Naga37s-1]
MAFGEIVGTSLEVPRVTSTLRVLVRDGGRPFDVDQQLLQRKQALALRSSAGATSAEAGHVAPAVGATTLAQRLVPEWEKAPASVREAYESFLVAVQSLLTVPVREAYESFLVAVQSLLSVPPPILSHPRPSRFPSAHYPTAPASVREAYESFLVAIQSLLATEVSSADLHEAAGAAFDCIDRQLRARRAKQAGEGEGGEDGSQSDGLAGALSEADSLSDADLGSIRSAFSDLLGLVSSELPLIRRAASLSLQLLAWQRTSVFPTPKTLLTIVCLHPSIHPYPLLFPSRSALSDLLGLVSSDLPLIRRTASLTLQLLAWQRAHHPQPHHHHQHRSAPHQEPSDSFMFGADVPFQVPGAGLDGNQLLQQFWEEARARTQAQAQVDSQVDFQVPAQVQAQVPEHRFTHETAVTGASPDVSGGAYSAADGAGGGDVGGSKEGEEGPRDLRWLHQSCVEAAQWGGGAQLTADELSLAVLKLMQSPGSGDEVAGELFNLHRKALVSAAQSALSALKEAVEADAASSSASNSHMRHGATVTVQTESEKQLEKLRKKEDKKIARAAAKTGGGGGVGGGGAGRGGVEGELAWLLGAGGFSALVEAGENKVGGVIDALIGTGDDAVPVRALPVGTKRNAYKGYEEVHVPPATAEGAAGRAQEKLVRVGEMEPFAQKAFEGFQTLNRIQSRIYQRAFYSNENLLVCAPTGAGKTNIAMITVLHEVGANFKNGVLQKNDFKIVYVAPMKALAAEMAAAFGRRLAPLGLSVRELTGDMQLNKREMEETQMIVTTPEKWDVITRKSSDVSMASLVRLLVIDEVHLLNDDRGPVIETLVARTLRQVESSQSMIRIVGLSATLPNYTEVAQFLRVNLDTGLFYFDASYRPVPLSQQYIGVSEPNFARRNTLMHEIAYEKAMNAVKNGKQAMVFVHSRKDTVKTARILMETAQRNDESELFNPQEQPQYKLMEKDVMRSRNREMGELFQAGFGIHHAGMLRPDRSLTEKLFSMGLIKVLVCTATLAWGVNLPAHTVIIKSTQLYDAKVGGFRELGMLDVMQIFGRAGRPQFDSSGEGIIITAHSQLAHYLRLMTHQLPIESQVRRVSGARSQLPAMLVASQVIPQFVAMLKDNLNAEVVLGTVTNVKEASAWLGYTYLFVRMQANPLAYGMTWQDVAMDPGLVARRQALITEAARSLDRAKMMRFDERSGQLYVTELGRVASHFYIRYTSVETYNELLRRHMSESELSEFENVVVVREEQTTELFTHPYPTSPLSLPPPTPARLWIVDLIARSSEFENIVVREEEMPELFTLRSKFCPLDVKGGPEDKIGKIKILIQASVGGESLYQDKIGKIKILIQASVGGEWLYCLSPSHSSPTLRISSPPPSTTMECSLFVISFLRPPALFPLTSSPVLQAYLSRGYLDSFSLIADTAYASALLGRIVHPFRHLMLPVYLSRGYLDSFSLIADTAYVSASLGRITRALFEITLKRGWCSLAASLLEMAKAVDQRIWPHQHPLRQFESVISQEMAKAVDLRIWPQQHPPRQFESVISQEHPLRQYESVLSQEVGRLRRVKRIRAASRGLFKLEDRGLDLDQLCDMLESTPYFHAHACARLTLLQVLFKLEDRGLDLDRLFLVSQCVSQFPYLELDAHISPITRTVLQVTLYVTPTFQWKERFHGNAQRWWIWVEARVSGMDSENEHIYHTEYFILSKKMMAQGTHTLTFTIPIFEPLPPQYYVKAISDNWLSSSSTHTISFRHLILPEVIFFHPARAPPAPHRAAQSASSARNSPGDPQAIGLYGFSHFNPIQTQAFHTLYHSDHSVLLGAPTGSGKTISAELAMLRLFRTQPGMKVIYIAPLKALVRERMEDWGKNFMPKLGKCMVELTGDLTPDMKLLVAADVIVATPEKWDGITRSWHNRSYAQTVGLMVMDEIHLLGQDRGPVLEVIVSRMRYISARTSRPIRFLGLSTALANARDLADWLGIEKVGLFNFKPSVRPVPLDVHIQGYPGKFYCPRMNAMNKPLYAAILTHSPVKPVLVFVSSRRQTRLTALDLIQYAAADERPRQFVHASEEEMEAHVAMASSAELKHTLQFGIGLHHAGLTQGDRSLVETLFAERKIQVLVCTSTLAWGVNLPAHLVVVKGTEYFDGKQKRYVEMPITDVLQMMGRAGRPQFDNEAKAVILVHEPKKSFYKKFLYEPFPVESSLHLVLHNHLNAEVAGGSIASVQDALDYLTWTFFFRRLLCNPSFYGLSDTSPEAVNVFLSDLVSRTLSDLDAAGCIALHEDGSVDPLPPGLIASQYYLHFTTAALFTANLTSPPAAAAITLETVLHVLCGAAEFDELPVRHNEEFVNAELAKHVRWKVDHRTYDDPHTKTNLLLQAHCARLAMPMSDYETDLKSVLDQTMRVLQAMIDTAATAGQLQPAVLTMRLTQMVIQAVWCDLGSPIAMLPHVTPSLEDALSAARLASLSALLSASPHHLRQLLSSHLSPAARADFLQALGMLPRVSMSVRVLPFGTADGGKTPAKSAAAATSAVVVEVSLRRSRPHQPHSLRAYTPFFPKVKEEGWWVVVAAADSPTLLALKRVSFTHRLTTRLHVPELQSSVKQVCVS